MPTRVVRPVEPGDLDEVAGIYAHYVTGSVATFDETPPTPADWRQKAQTLRGAGLPFLVVEVGGELAGFGYASQWRPKPAYRHSAENTIYLAPGRTGAGLGSLLLGAVLDGCAAAGVRQVIAVIADTGSDASAALHRRHGFVEVGRLRSVGFKHGRWIDTTIFQRDLTAG
ncbi:GNAT family N-acetyltransferase [Micromonospora sp. NBC_01796]|uniref:GNAT family N-acetyltransferase n=1 Tax=Micromonospora sp. NBC_01796 TaxID=2975987 RepID=UPI002DD826CE|nr:GNAT family N-acetyltransferase [Micromonospora sp. NBC_01796]WSA89152.1 GNAT family N-acetyltransferase [Micromonospora sp. NBC_01796]